LQNSQIGSCPQGDPKEGPKTNSHDAAKRALSPENTRKHVVSLSHPVFKSTLSFAECTGRHPLPFISVQFVGFPRSGANC